MTITTQLIEDFQKNIEQSKFSLAAFWSPSIQLNTFENSFIINKINSFVVSLDNFHNFFKTKQHINFLKWVCTENTSPIEDKSRLITVCLQRIILLFHYFSRMLERKHYFSRMLERKCIERWQFPLPEYLAYSHQHEFEFFLATSAELSNSLQQKKYFQKYIRTN